MVRGGDHGQLVKQRVAFLTVVRMSDTQTDERQPSVATN